MTIITFKDKGGNVVFATSSEKKAEEFKKRYNGDLVMEYYDSETNSGESKGTGTQGVH